MADLARRIGFDVVLSKAPAPKPFVRVFDRADVRRDLGAAEEGRREEQLVILAHAATDEDLDRMLARGLAEAWARAEGLNHTEAELDAIGAALLAESASTS